MSDHQMFDVDCFLKHLTTDHIGRNVVYKQTTETTMDDALQLAKSGALHGTLVLAEDQTNARGYKDRGFNATNIENIYASLVLHRPLEDKSNKGHSGEFNPEIATTLAARGAIAEMGVHSIQIKWPNDLWARGHKMGGFLVEPSDYVIPDVVSGPRLGLFILGIGLNVNYDIRRDQNLSAIATSVACELGGATVSREMLLARLCNQLEINLQKSQKELYDEFLQYSLFKPGDPILIHDKHGKIFDAEIIEIQETWRMLVKYSDGSQHELMSSGVSLRPKVWQTVLVLVRGDVLENSCNTVYSLLNSLVDKVTTAVEYVKIRELNSAILQKDVQVIVVDRDVHSDDVDWVKTVAETVRTFVKNGGGILCIDKTTEFATTWFPELNLRVNPVKSNTTDCLNLVLQTDTTSDNVIRGFANNGHSKCFDLLSGECVIACYAHDNTPAIISREYEKGVICLCGIHIEFLHTSWTNLLDKELFKRDLLLQHMLQKCGLNIIL
ncbi:bifunctional ligase/repressor BirA-like [Gigantopelta aegis]|uniref:bifunctional ligase/repressor BirA-like n=1 Tax=Gigantopelta aegis TaxID=1735272 RepID=UPI001B88AB33|nr:bifunctional ligase/repressor BirA-like [Gigantopelta aegis]